MASRLVKAQKVVPDTELKMLRFPTFEATPEETETPRFEEQQVDIAELKREHEQAMAQEREQSEQELLAWKEQQQEQFLLEQEEEKRRGYQEAYEIGIDEGRNHGIAEYRERIEQAKAILEQAYEEKVRVIQEAEPFVIELSLEIAKKILQQELKTNEEALLPMIKESLSSVYESSSLSIHVAPEDHPFVQKQREQLLEVVNGKMEVKILPDYSIQEGGCIIHTSSGSVDARIDVQLSEIKKALLAYQQEEYRRE